MKDNNDPRKHFLTVEEAESYVGGGVGVAAVGVGVAGSVGAPLLGSGLQDPSGAS